MCQLTETYYAYCQHFGPRRPSELCPRASAIPSFATTGCWYSTCSGTVTLFEACPNCRSFPPDHEERVGFDDSTGITRRTMEERGPGRDQGIWLKSFGRRPDGPSREASRYGTPTASRTGSVYGSNQTSGRSSQAQSGHCSPKERRRSKADNT